MDDERPEAVIVLPHPDQEGVPVTSGGDEIRVPIVEVQPVDEKRGPTRRRLLREA